MIDSQAPRIKQTTVEAILRTLLYSDVFDFPLSAWEIHYYLIGEPASGREVTQALEKSQWLLQRIEQANGYYAIRGRADTVLVREVHAAAYDELWPAARRYGRVIGGLPFVRMVAVSGALAVNNAMPGDDIDYLIVTAPGRVWLARLMVVAIVKLARWSGVDLCPNYVLSEDALTQGRRDLFTAHELAQMVPLMGLGVYQAMRDANHWAEDHLPNATVLAQTEAKLNPAVRLLQRMAQWLLGGKLGDRLEAWERERKIAKFAQQASYGASDAILGRAACEGPFCRPWHSYHADLSRAAG